MLLKWDGIAEMILPKSDIKFQAERNMQICIVSRSHVDRKSACSCVEGAPSQQASIIYKHTPHKLIHTLIAHTTY